MKTLKIVLITFIATVSLCYFVFPNLITPGSINITESALTPGSIDITESTLTPEEATSLFIERHISVESGRNIYEKLASSSTYAPFPVYLIGNNQSHTLYKIPVNIMLKDNADDIQYKIENYQ